MNKQQTNQTPVSETSIQIGSKVRSFDFDSRDITGEDACYVEGEVVDIQWDGGCDRYVILVEKQVWGGVEESDNVGFTVQPPVNGIPKLFGGVTDGVELI